MTNVASDSFSADCTSWLAYKPCPEQIVQNLHDCGGCGSYSPKPPVLGKQFESYDPRHLGQARSIGIVEVGGLGSVLRTTTVSRAIRLLNPNARILWFTHERGARLLRYVPGVTPINIEQGDSRNLEVIKSLDLLINFESTSAARPYVSRARRVAGFTLNAQGNFHGVMPYAATIQRLQIDDGFRRNNTNTMQELLLNSVGLDSVFARYDIEPTRLNSDRASRILESLFPHGRGREFIGLNVGTSDKGRLRRWPAERYAQLANQLAARNPDRSTIILSGPDDFEVVSVVRKALGNSPNVAVAPSNLEVGTFWLS